MKDNIAQFGNAWQGKGCGYPGCCCGARVVQAESVVQTGQAVVVVRLHSEGCSLELG